MRFIRKHGRIIPIREPNDNQKALAKGAAGGTAGVLGAAAAGHISGELERRANRASAASVRTEVRASRAQGAAARVNKHGQMNLFGVNSRKTYTGFMELSEKHAQKAEKLRAAAKVVSKVGHVAAGAAIGGATYKALEHTKFKNDEKTKAAAGTASGVAASFAIEHARANKLGANLSFGKMLKSGLKTAAVKIGRFAVRKL